MGGFLMKCFSALVVLVALLALPVIAEDLQDVVVSGKLNKTERNGKTVYTLETMDGEVILPAAAKGVKLDDFVGSDVEVSAKGKEETKAGLTTISVKEIVAIKKAAKPAPAPEPPAEPEAAPAPAE